MATLPGNEASLLDRPGSPPGAHSLPTETTRYLCAAAHLYAKVRDWIIEQIIEEEHKAIGPSFGVDIIAVATQCLAARRRETTRDVLLLIMLIGSLCPILAFAAFEPRAIPFLVLGFVIVAWIVVAAEMWVGHYRVAAKCFSKGRYRPEAVSVRLDARQKRWLATVAADQAGNVVVYSGYSPFVGAGFNIGGWSFALNAQKGAQDIGGQTRQAHPFTVDELYDRLAQGIWALGIEGMCIEDKLYVNGTEIRGDLRFLSNPLGRPCAHMNPAVVRAFVGCPTESVRHYLSIRVNSWRGELVLSIFVRFAKIGQSLFAEASYFLLPPLKEEYRKGVDALQPSPTWRQRGALVGRSLVLAPFLWLLSPFSVCAKLNSQVARRNRRREQERLIMENPSFDYGAATTLRQSMSSAAYQQYFQRLDKEMYLKIIERQLLDDIIMFLESKDIDTSDLKERQTAILNSGVIISGGSIQAENLAIGDEARAGVTRVARAARTTAAGSA